MLLREFIFYFLKLIFSVFLDYFNVLILKIYFFKKYYFNIFLNKKHFIKLPLKKTRNKNYTTNHVNRKQFEWLVGDVILFDLQLISSVNL
jgi:hypothetical protein